jgi:hypothetical protein
MKHIKLFEDYSDEEIEGLLGDLETIGHTYRLIPGEDFGFGKDIQQQRKWFMKRPNTGYEDLVIKKSVVEDMLKKGLMKRDSHTPGAIYFDDSVGLSLKYPSYSVYRYFQQGIFDPSEGDYSLEVKPHVRLSTEERLKIKKDFAQEVFDYLSSIRK